jgi:mercuric ion transport protein
MRRSVLMGSSIAAAFAASLCCILPLVAAATGVAALGVAARFEHWRPVLLGITLVLFVAAALVFWRDTRRNCAADGCCNIPNSRRNGLVVLGMTGLAVIALAVIPAYSGVAAHAFSEKGKSAKAAPAAATEARFHIVGMTCKACSGGLEASFGNMPGVHDAQVNYETGQATIHYDPQKQSQKNFEKLVTDSGYRVEK